MHSCIYVGDVNHRRFRPNAHAFTYRLFMLYLDLDELPTLFQRYWLWSATGRNLASFRRSDHLGPAEVPLAEAVRTLIERETGQRPSGRIGLLTHLSYFGFRFNPASFYYCFDASGQTLEYIVVEVNNTPWGEQYCYVLDAKANQGSASHHRYAERKRFHVSPFMPMNMDYDWRFSQPDQRLSVHMQNLQDQQKIFDATLKLERREISSRALATALLRFPLMTGKVVAGIYFEALRLWLKRTPLFDHPGKEAPNPVKPS